MVKDAVRVAGHFTTEECEMLVDDVNKNLARFETIRQTHLDNGLPPPLYFKPVVPGMTIDRTKRPFHRKPPIVSRPANLDDVAFWPLTHLAELIRRRQVRYVELMMLLQSRATRQLGALSRLRKQMIDHDPLNGSTKPGPSSWPS